MPSTSKTPPKLVRATKRLAASLRELNWPGAESWEDIALRYPGVSKTLLWKIALHGHQPSHPPTLRALGLPVLIPVEPCACGVVHRKGHPRPRPVTVKLATDVSAEIARQVDASAAALGVSRAEWVRRALNGALGV